MAIPPKRFVPEAVHWHDGMLLTPEHFTELGIRGETMLESLASSLPFHWGVSSLTIDPSKLAQGKVVLLELDAVFPDGFWVRLRRQEESPERDLEALAAEDDSFNQKPFFVYAVIPAPGGDESSAMELRKLRYIDESGDSGAPVEEAGNDDDAPIPRLRVNLELQARHDPPPAKYVSIPLAKLERMADRWDIHTSYQPPVRILPEDSPVLGQVGKVLERVRNQAVGIHTRWNNMTALERTEGDDAQYELWKHFAAGLPPCEALHAAGSVTPFSLYLALCSLAGRASTLTKEAVPKQFSRYDHNDIAASYAQVLDYLDKVLDEAAADAFTAIPFRYEQGLFTLDLKQEWLGRDLILAIRGLRTADPALRTWGETVLIGSRSQQDGMRMRRELGARRRFLHMERGLSVGPNVVLFAIESEGPYMRPGEPLDLVGAPGSDFSQLPREVTLYVRKKTSTFTAEAAS